MYCCIIIKTHVREAQQDRLSILIILINFLNSKNCPSEDAETNTCCEETQTGSRAPMQEYSTKYKRCSRCLFKKTTSKNNLIRYQKKKSKAHGYNKIELHNKIYRDKMNSQKIKINEINE